MQLQSNELLPELGDVRNIVEFANILNSESPGDSTIDLRNISDNLLQSSYDEISGSATFSSDENALQTVPTPSTARESIGLIQEKID